MKLSLVTAISAAFLLALGQPAPAEDLASSIVGVWKFKGQHIKEVASGKIDYPLGQNPTGHLVCTKGGHIVSVLAGDNRKAPASPAFTDAERVALFNTMVALSGTYQVEGNTVTVTYTTSWNQTFTGTTQKRQIELAGNKLTVTSAPFKNEQGQDAIIVVTLERVE